MGTLFNGHQEEVAACLQNTLANCAVTETDADPIVIQNKIAEMNREFDRLLLLAGDEENEFLDRKLQQVNDELLSLKQLKKRAEQAIEQNKNRTSKVQEIIRMISADDITIHECSDALTYRIIEQITILSKEEIRIRFVGGYEMTQSLV